jgi:hypothetical protein
MRARETTLNPELNRRLTLAEESGTPTCLLCREMRMQNHGDYAECVWDGVKGVRPRIPLPDVPKHLAGSWTKKARKCPRYESMVSDPCGVEVLRAD